jgi:hypothetical protein
MIKSEIQRDSLCFIGDMVPTTFIGKLITFPAMMFGVLVNTIMLPVCHIDLLTHKLAYCLTFHHCW